MTVALRLEGRSPYAPVHALQERLVALRADRVIDDVIVLLEHPETITIGRHRQAGSSVLTPGGVPVVQVERGGDATYHAPGQLVAYPIMALDGERRDLHRHLHDLEDAVIALLATLDVEAGRDARNTGVWLPATGQKICSIGIACRRWVTWHGLALNVDVDLAGFARINPCGFDATIMARLADVRPGATLDSLVAPLAEALRQQLELSPLRWLQAQLSNDADIEAIVAAVRA